MQVTLVTYAELTQLVTAWYTTRQIPLLAIVSRPGLGKTEAARAIAGENTLRLDTHVTPLALYQYLYVRQDQPIVLDDLAEQVIGGACLQLLKALCDSTPTRTVGYHSTTHALGDTPRTFTTRSPVLLLTNDLLADSPGQQALISRAVAVRFCPSVDAVLAYVDTWAEDREVFHWYAERLYLFPQFSARDYAVSLTLRRAGLDWQQLALRSAGIQPMPQTQTQATIPF